MEASQRGSLPRTDSVPAAIMSFKDMMEAIENEHDDSAAMQILMDWEASRRPSSATPGGDSDTVSLSSTTAVASGRDATSAESRGSSLSLSKESAGDVTATHARPPSLVEFGAGNIRKKPATGRCFFRVSDTPGGDSDTDSLSSTSTVVSSPDTAPGKDSEGDITATYARPPTLVEVGPGSIRKKPVTGRCFFRETPVPAESTLENAGPECSTVKEPPPPCNKGIPEDRYEDVRKRRVASCPALTYHLPREYYPEDDWDSDSDTEDVPAYLQYSLRQAKLFGEFLDNPFTPLPARPRNTWSLGVDPLETEEHTFCGCDKCVYFHYALMRDHAEPHPLADCLEGALSISTWDD